MTGKTVRLTRSIRPEAWPAHAAAGWALFEALPAEGARPTRLIVTLPIPPDRQGDPIPLWRAIASQGDNPVIPGINDTAPHETTPNETAPNQTTPKETSGGASPPQGTSEQGAAAQPARSGATAPDHPFMRGDI